MLSEFPDVFSDKIGSADLVEHEIRLTNDKPVVRAPYKVLESLQGEVEKEFERLLAANIIVESDSNYCAPMICVRKSNKGLRFYCNWRELNKFTQHDNYLMNNPAEIISEAAVAKYHRFAGSTGPFKRSDDFSCCI